jgi:hypothetical protein
MSESGFDWLNPPQLSREDRAVAGCNCGGLRLHVLDCSIFTMATADAEQAIAEAEAKVRAHTDMLNARLRAMPPAAPDTGRWSPVPDRITVTYERQADGG